MRVWVPIDLPDGARVRHAVIETNRGDWQKASLAGPVRFDDDEAPAKPTPAVSLPPQELARRPLWEYRIIGVAEMGVGRTEPKVAEQICNDLGAKGWEIVHVTRGGVWFKRPLLP